MKIRKGFVSNSSSSCFICGMYTDAENKYSIEEATDILQKMLNFYNDLEKQNLPFKDVFNTPKIGTAGDLCLLKNFNKHLTEEQVCGKLLIESASDNTIPWILFEAILYKFNAKRIHLG